jgi:hypothetical protein
MDLSSAVQMDMVLSILRSVYHVEQIVNANAMEDVVHAQVKQLVLAVLLVTIYQAIPAQHALQSVTVLNAQMHLLALSVSRAIFYQVVRA